MQYESKKAVLICGIILGSLSLVGCVSSLRGGDDDPTDQLSGDTETINNNAIAGNDSRDSGSKNISRDTNDDSNANTTSNDDEERDILEYVRNASDINRYFLLANDDENVVTIVDIETKASVGTIPIGQDGYVILTSRANYPCRDYLIVLNKSDNMLYRYTIATQSFDPVPMPGGESKSLSARQGVEVVPSLTEYGNYLIHRWTYAVTDDSPTKTIVERTIYGYNAYDNTIVADHSSRLSYADDVDCLLYDSLNQRLLTYSCGAGLGPTMPIKEMIAGQSYKNASLLFAWNDFPLLSGQASEIADPVSEIYAVSESGGDIFVWDRSMIQSDTKLLMIYGAPIPGDTGEGLYKVFSVPAHVWREAGVDKNPLSRIHSLKHLPQHNAIVLGGMGHLVALTYNDADGVVESARIVSSDTLYSYEMLSDGEYIYVMDHSGSTGSIAVRDRMSQSLADFVPQWEGYRFIEEMYSFEL